VARIGDRGRDRMEAAGVAFHHRVAEGFRSLAAAEPVRWAVVDGSPPVDEVAAAVRDLVRDRLGLPA
jgi:dTMP kinase